MTDLTQKFQKSLDIMEQCMPLFWIFYPEIQY